MSSRAKDGATPERAGDARATSVSRSPEFSPAVSRLGGGVTRKTPSAPTRAALAVTSRDGAPLDAHTRAELEPLLPVDLADVRIHTDAAADRAARSVDASAFTIGSHIAFRDGAYDASSSRGRHLVAHELVHVAQHARGAADTSQIEPPGGATEREADELADRLIAGQRVEPVATPDGVLARNDPEPAMDEEEGPALDYTASAEDIEGDDATGAHVPFEYSISRTDPSIVLVPIFSNRDEIARELGTDISAFYVVGAAEAGHPDPEQQAIRFYAPSVIPPDVMREMRTRFDTRLRRDVDATIAALVAESGGWSATEFVLRWSQYADYYDNAGTSYFDRYLDLLRSRTITTTTDYGLWTTSSSRSGLEELLAETSGDANAAVLRALARSGHVAGMAHVRSLAVADSPLQRGHVIGRWLGGRDNASVAGHIANTLVFGISAREEAEIRIRNAHHLGPKVLILGSDGLWYGYGIYWDTRASGTLLPPVVGGEEERGRFYWYYPSTLYFHPREFDANGPADQPLVEMVQREILGDALASPDAAGIVALDHGALRLASTEQRVRMFRKVLDAGFDDPYLQGYTSRDAADALARAVLAMQPEDFLAFERALDAAGLTARLLALKDPNMAPLGRAFTYQTLAAAQLGANAFADPTQLTQGSENPSSSIHYYLAQVETGTSHVVPRDEWAPSATVTADSGDPVEPGLEGEAEGDIDRTLVSFEHGTSPTGWGDTPAWSRRSRDQTRQFLPIELLVIESVSPSGRSRRIATAFEAAITQGDPESEVSHESMMDFFNVLLLLQGGGALLRLGSAGLRAMAAGSLRAALSLFGRQLVGQTGRAAARSMVDLALFNAARYAHHHQEELERTPEGRAFVAAVTAATVVLAARDISRLVESGAIERVVATARGALTVAGGAARQAIRHTLQNFRAARLAWTRLEQEGLLVTTNVGGFVVRQPQSLGDFANAYRMGQAQAAGEELMTAVGTGSAESARVQSMLGRLEREAGGFAGRAPGTRLSGDEAEVARAYRDFARYASELPAAQRTAFFDAVDGILATPSRSASELAPFIRGAIRAGGRGADAVAYLEAATWLAQTPISREGLARLANNALGRNPVDLVWLRGRSLTPDDLDFLARDPHTPWRDYMLASLDPSDVGRIKRALRGTRGAGAEIVVGEEASTLVPGFRVNQRQVPARSSEIDYELISTDGLARRRPLEVKGWTSRQWQRSLDAHTRRIGGETLTDSMEIAGARSIDKTITQLTDAATIASRGEAPMLAVTDAMTAAQRTALRDILDLNGLGNVQIVYLPEASITAASGRLGRALGFR